MVNEISREELINQLEQKASAYEFKGRNCCQGTLLALQEQFKLGNSSVLKAATAFPGIAARGDTCGAVVGALLALGLVYGRDDIEDMEGFTTALRTARRFCRRFEEEFGSLMCRDVQKVVVGRTYNLIDPAEEAEFERAGGYEKCGLPPAKAVRIVAEMIMEKKK